MNNNKDAKNPLDIRGQKQLESISKTVYSNPITSLSIAGHNILQVNLSDLPPLDSCTAFGMNGMRKIRDIDLTPLVKASQLKHIYISHTGFRRLEMSFLSKCKHLQSLTLLINENLSEIVLPEKWGSSEGFSEDYNSPEWLDYKIYIAGSKIEQLDLSGLETDMETIYITSNHKLRNINLPNIAVRKVILERNVLEDIDLSPICGPELWSIDLFKNRIRKLDLTCMVRSPNLRILKISQNPIYDRIDFTPLYRCKSFYCLIGNEYMTYVYDKRVNMESHPYLGDLVRNYVLFTKSEARRRGR